MSVAEETAPNPYTWRLCVWMAIIANPVAMVVWAAIAAWEDFA